MENLYRYDSFTMSEIHSKKSRNNCFTCLVKLNNLLNEKIIQKAVLFFEDKLYNCYMYILRPTINNPSYFK